MLYGNPIDHGENTINWIRWHSMNPEQKLNHLESLFTELSGQRL